jgi:CheY-like chemotaxis protein
MAFSKQFNLKLFNDSNAALKYINEQQRANSLIERNEKPKLQGESEVWVKEVLTRQNLKRFDELRVREVSVVIVDYSMPGMNGIDFCEKINNSSIKKILLTGHATSTEVVKAFNNNSIQYYLKKNDENMIEDLESKILQLQHQYFNELSSNIKSEAIDSSTPFFSDPQLAKYFQSNCESLGVMEYFYLTNPSRFSLRTKNHDKFLCVIYTEDEMKEHLQVLREENAPEKLCSAIDSREFIPYFQTADGYYEPSTSNSLSNVYPASQIEGIVNYYCAIIPDGTNNVSSTIKLSENSFH